MYNNLHKTAMCSLISTSVFGNSYKELVIKNNTVPLFSPSLCLTHTTGHDNELLCCIKDWTFLEELSEYQLLKKDSAPWS
jgi:hypothetical protein